MPTARAFMLRTAPKVAALRVSIAIARDRWRNWLRKQRRSPFYTDLRLIAREHRHKYAGALRRAGNCGTAIGILLLAYDRKHFRAQCEQQSARISKLDR